ncbi:bacteriocin immunity protein [Lactiplantibacillus xiangfangensis]|uniref:Bacteriocin immunity protein n=1 Tax=Lactiplantibacillus xiangfangensis TaxID=942150 RepID=A0A0R2MDL7_9LACO|nr:bacteriocin immunity protein [Lactiplantibacillus xiangfangensis]KRO11782.1 hypothetical protein IV64_GL002172 [Lactiplantibacillus xiangfangensis]
MAKSAKMQLVELIDTALSNKTISKAEVVALTKAQEGLSKHQSDTMIASKLKTELSLLGAQQKLSPQLVDLLTWLSKSYLGWGRRGMGITNLFV